MGNVCGWKGGVVRDFSCCCWAGVPQFSYLRGSNLRELPAHSLDDFSKRERVVYLVCSRVSIILYISSRRSSHLNIHS